MPHKSPTKRSGATAYEPHILLFVSLLLLAVTLALLALLDPASLQELANTFTLAIR